MNWKMARRNVGKLVKIRPKVLYSSIDDGDWFVQSVDASTRSMSIEHLGTGHVATLTGDCISNWADDPAEINRGYLMLTRQLAFHGCNISYEPLVRAKAPAALNPTRFATGRM